MAPGAHWIILYSYNCSSTKRISWTFKWWTLIMGEKTLQTCELRPKKSLIMVWITWSCFTLILFFLLISTGLVVSNTGTQRVLASNQHV